MLRPVHQISDIMEVPGDLHQLHRPLRAAQRPQNISRVFRRHGDMGKAVLREAQGGKGFIRPLDIGSDGSVVFYIAKGQQRQALLRFFLSGIGHRHNDTMLTSYQQSSVESITAV